MQEEIELFKKDLDKLIKENSDYEEIYELSKKLDELIVSYYKELKRVSNK